MINVFNADFLQLKTSDKLLLFAILLTSIVFSIYWFISNAKEFKKYFQNKFVGDKFWLTYIFFQKVTGFIFLGLIPLFFILFFIDYSPHQLGLNLSEFSTSLFYSAPMSILILLINFFATKKERSMNTYPQMRIEKWTIKLFSLNILLWILYLVAYEFLFRGVLLFICFNALGFWPATAINIALYSTTHIPKGAAETFSCIFYGLLLCIITVYTGSIFVAFFTHLVMAVSNDFFSIYHNPKMRFAK